jgi:NHLM bacteriocin system ABC transporter ATP-binding protein
MRTQTSALGALDAVETRSAFALDAPATMWVVRSGAVELFSIRHAANQSSALRPLFQVAAGQAIFSLHGGAPCPASLFARVVPDSDVEVRPLPTFDAIGADDEDLLSEWVAALSRAAAATLMPKDVEWLARGATAAANGAPRSVSSRERLLWVRQRSGAGRLLGRPEAALAAGDALYPLSRNGWIEIDPASELAAVDTVTHDDVAACRGGLAAFHTAVLACIAANVDADDDRERQRLRRRAESDLRSVESALYDLASPLAKPRDDAPARNSDTLDTPLMRACEAIGGVLGVTMKPHRDMVRGLTVHSPVAAVAQASGIRYRQVALKDTWATAGSEPLLVFRNDDGAPAALLPGRGRGRYSIYDPVQRTVARLEADAVATLNPFAFMFYKPFPQKALSVRDLMAFGLGGNRREILTIVAMSMATGLIAMLTPYVTGVVFDSTIPNARRGELVTISVMLIVTALVTALFNLARGLAVLRLQGRLSLSLQAALWDRLLSLPLPFFRDYAAGDLAQRSTAFAQIRSALTGATLNVMLSGVSSIFSFGMLFIYSTRLALIATLMTLIAVALTMTAGVLGVRLQRQISQQAGHLAALAVEFISAIAKFRVAGAERRAFVLWVKAFAAQKRLDFRARNIGTVLAVFNSVYVVTCMGVLYFVNAGVPAWRDDTLTTGTFLAFMTAFGQFMGAALSMGSAVVGVSNIVPLYERASPILQTLPEVTTAQTAPGELKGEVEAHHLVFRYHADGPVVLRDVSFHVRPGEYVAFVGPSGCGKSTLFRLLLGFESAASGAIYYDGADLAGLDAQNVRSQMGVVLQTGTLLAGSIKDNIAGGGWVPMDDIWEAARLAGLEADIKNMPMGLHTVVQAGGGGLSGGQRQRILIARAIVHRPRLLLFDEATSALDNRTQAIVSESIKTLKATRIVIAHRLSTIVEADRIIVMDQGRIVQSGTYAELLKEEGLFRELAQRQIV